MDGPGDGEEPDSEPEWAYLTFDSGRTCSVCGGDLGPGQAAGYAEGKVFHARCVPERPRTCAACRGEIGRGDAVGLVHGQLFHARCVPDRGHAAA